MPTLILIRHGQSLWNAQNRFTGWEDIDLSPQGKEEALKAAHQLQEQKIYPDAAWTSVLKRAHQTLHIILQEMNISNIPIHSSWRLNERHYGRLQGMNKNEAVQKYGKEQVFKWRRSFETRPPQISKNASNHPSKNSIYKNVDHHFLPEGESLKDTMERVLPLWKNTIEKTFSKNKNILIVAHGNSLRSLVKYIKKMSDQEIPLFEIPTARPLIIKWRDLKNKDRTLDVFRFL